MDILINKFSQWLDDGEYKKILEISQLIFNLIAPSFSYIFLYERNLFRQIDILKFLILCIILILISSLTEGFLVPSLLKLVIKLFI